MGNAQIQGEQWGRAARDWVTLQEPMHKPVWEAMLIDLSVDEGTRLFDAGCGGGGASLLAAQRGADVTGLDASDALIALARERVPEGDFRAGDLEALPYDEQTFDAIIASLAVQYTADPIAALRELKRVCADEGILAISTWGPPEQCEQRVIFKAVRDVMPSPPKGGGPFALSASGALEKLVEQAGWKVIGDGEAECPFEYPDLETFWRAQRAAGPLQAQIGSLGEERLRAAVEEAVEPYRTKSGGVHLENRFRYITART